LTNTSLNSQLTQPLAFSLPPSSFSTDINPEKQTGSAAKCIHFRGFLPLPIWVKTQVQNTYAEMPVSRQSCGLISAYRHWTASEEKTKLSFDNPNLWIKMRQNAEKKRDNYLIFYCVSDSINLHQHLYTLQSMLPVGLPEVCLCVFHF